MGIEEFTRIFLSFIFICLLSRREVSAVSVARIRVPPQVRHGETVGLSCDFDLGTQSLYSLNWWKGSQQFYQFTPKAQERKVVYDTPGVDVVLPKSDLKNVVLRNVTLLSSGQYRCEIVADFPSYERDSVAASMEVVEVPRSNPVVSLSKIKYNIGDILVANCTSSGTRPPSKLIWSINGREVQPHHSKMILPSSPNHWLDDILEESPDVIHIGDVDDLHAIPINEVPLPPIKSSITMALRQFHFSSGGRSLLSCSATLRGLYHKTTEVQLTLPGVSPVEPSQRVSQGGTLEPSLFLVVLLFIIYKEFSLANLNSSTTMKKHNSSTLTL